MPCQEGRKVYQSEQNTRKDTLLKRQQFVTKNQETSVKTELSPDKHLTLSNLSVNAELSPDKLHIPASEELYHLQCTDFGKVRNL